jgi:hypothetical protein
MAAPERHPRLGDLEARGEGPILQPPRGACGPTSRRSGSAARQGREWKSLGARPALGAARGPAPTGSARLDRGGATGHRQPGGTPRHTSRVFGVVRPGARLPRVRPPLPPGAAQLRKLSSRLAGRATIPRRSAPAQAPGVAASGKLDRPARSPGPGFSRRREVSGSGPAPASATSEVSPVRYQLSGATRR